jgi:hypothetical protein
MAKDFTTMEDSNRSSNPSIHAVSDPARRIVIRGGLTAALTGLLAPLAGCAVGDRGRGFGGGPQIGLVTCCHGQVGVQWVAVAREGSKPDAVGEKVGLKRCARGWVRAQRMGVGMSGARVSAAAKLEPLHPPFSQPSQHRWAIQVLQRSVEDGQSHGDAKLNPGWALRPVQGVPRLSLVLGAEVAHRPR